MKITKLLALGCLGLALTSTAFATSPVAAPESQANLSSAGLDVTYDPKTDDYILRVSGNSNLQTRFGEIRVSGGINFDQSTDSKIDESQLELQAQYVKNVIQVAAVQLAVAAGAEAEAEPFGDLGNLVDKDTLESSAHLLAIARFNLMGFEVTLNPGYSRKLTDHVIRTVRDGRILMGSVSRSVMGKKVTLAGGTQQKENVLGERFDSPEASLTVEGSRLAVRAGWDREELAGEKINRYSSGVVLKLGSRR